MQYTDFSMSGSCPAHINPDKQSSTVFIYYNLSTCGDTATVTIKLQHH